MSSHPPGNKKKDLSRKDVQTIGFHDMIAIGDG